MQHYINLLSKKIFTYRVKEKLRTKKYTCSVTPPPPPTHTVCVFQFKRLEFRWVWVKLKYHLKTISQRIDFNLVLSQI